MPFPKSPWLLWPLRLLAIALFGAVLAWQVVRKQQEGNAPGADPAKQADPSVSSAGSKPPPAPANPASATPPGPWSFKDFLAPAKPGWTANRNRQAVVFGTRLIGPQDAAPAPVLLKAPNSPPPTFIPSSKVMVVGRPEEVTPEFLQEFGVDLDLTPPPSKKTP